MSVGDRITFRAYVCGCPNHHDRSGLNVLQLRDASARGGACSTTNIAGLVLRDLNPAAGAPLNGPGNTGIAQPIDRVWDAHT